MCTAVAVMKIDASDEDSLSCNSSCGSSNESAATWPTAASCTSCLVQAYDIEQGTLAKWCAQGSGVTPPTAVLVHGILGSKRNLKSFTRMLLQVCHCASVACLSTRAV
jgi:hypothetical protein